MDGRFSMPVSVEANALLSGMPLTMPIAVRITVSLSM